LREIAISVVTTVKSHF